MNDLEGLNLTQLMERMEGLLVPPPVSWTPQTEGWAAVALFLAGVVLIVGLRVWVSYRRNAYRRAARRELADLAAAAPLDAARVAAVVKRTALAVYPRAEVAGLFGSEWASFLEESSGGQLGEADCALLSQAAYRGELAEQQRDTVLRAAERWVEVHRA